MPVDVSAEIAVPGVTAWAVAEDFAIGAFASPAGTKPNESSVVETHYCFGLWDSPGQIEVEGEGATLLAPDIVQFSKPGSRICVRRDCSKAPAADRWMGIVVSEEWLEAALGESQSTAAESRLLSRTFITPGLADLASFRALLRRAERGACLMEIEEELTTTVGRLLDAGTERREVKSDGLSARQSRLVRDADELLVQVCLEPITLGAIARELGVTPPHLARCYRAATGRTLYNRLTSIRLANAIERLADGASNLTDLALHLGYADHSHFTAAFRQRVGMPPRAFRAMCAA